MPAADLSDPSAMADAMRAQAKAGPTGGANAATAASPTSIRVDLERVDKLINVVGELVIQQAMLAQSVAESGLARSSSVAVGLEDLEQLTREIQESVMAIRAQPVKAVFQRMPRLVREVAEMTGKSVRLVTEGENTEVDKTVIDRLAEPITHMIRNAIDHGLEDAEGRRRAGKEPEGVIRLAALHRSGRIVIEVSDDGRGINRERVRAIAVERGLISADAALTSDEIDNLIFLPGFSTAPTVTDVSGRGVGMDVVKRSIQQLGGRIAIASTPDKGSTFTMSLPLTLAVLDGMVVEAGGETLLAPLSAVVESFTPKPSDLHRVGPSETLIQFRDRFLPLIDTAAALGFAAPSAPTASTHGIAIVVESEGGMQAALRVDGIHGQRQVVIKSLETNYTKVDGVSAATILGDGRVALILDVDALIPLGRRAHAEQRSEFRSANREVSPMTSATSPEINRELMAFRAGGQEFCIDIMTIREIRGWSPATPLPRTPSYVRGVINLRGAILPIVDLSARLGLSACEPDGRHVIMVVQIGERAVGMLVEAVSEILIIGPDDVQPAPEIASDEMKSLIRGIIPRDARLLSLLDVGLLMPEVNAEAA
jgi:two-component system chemotaxis sensor kinase CheA